MVLLSIIIPTKNRYTCLFPILESLTKYIIREDIEFIIQDNSDNNRSAITFFQNFKDKRCHYYYISTPLSIADNTIQAINHVRGKYVTFIGDDDLISPYIANIVDKMESMAAEALIFNCGYYWWNSVKFEKENYYKRKEALWIPSTISRKFIKKNSSDELNLLLNNGGTSIFNLPRFYHGIITLEILNKIKQKVGTYLIGSCPDIAFATAIALVIDQYYYLDYPVTIYGASSNSGGGLSANNRHYGKIEDQKFLKKNILEVWDINIPRIWSELTIYSETVSEVLREFKCHRKLNYNALYASMIINEFFLINYLKPTLNQYYHKHRIELFTFIKVTIKKLAGKINRNLKFKVKKHKYNVCVMPNVERCMKKLLEYKF